MSYATPHRRICAAPDMWTGEHIVQTYSQVSSVLNQTRGQILQDRIVLEQGLVKNIYENGCVYVNYNSEVRKVDEIEIGALSAIYVKGGE